jgi:hypothetical protein
MNYEYATFMHSFVFDKHGEMLAQTPDVRKYQEYVNVSQEDHALVRLFERQLETNKNKVEIILERSVSVLVNPDYGSPGYIRMTTDERMEALIRENNSLELEVLVTNLSRGNSKYSSGALLEWRDRTSILEGTTNYVVAIRSLDNTNKPTQEKPHQLTAREIADFIKFLREFYSVDQKGRNYGVEPDQKVKIIHRICSELSSYWGWGFIKS